MRQHFQSVWQSANLCYVMLYYYFSYCGYYCYLKISKKHWPLEESNRERNGLQSFACCPKRPLCLQLSLLISEKFSGIFSMFPFHSAMTFIGLLVCAGHFVSWDLKVNKNLCG